MWRMVRQRVRGVWEETEKTQHACKKTQKTGKHGATQDGHTVFFPEWRNDRAAAETAADGLAGSAETPAEVEARMKEYSWRMFERWTLPTEIDRMDEAQIRTHT